MTLIPVHPEPEPGSYMLYAVTWIQQDGRESTLLIGAMSPQEAAETVARLDPLLRRSPSNGASIDVRACGLVQTFQAHVSID